MKINLIQATHIVTHCFFTSTPTPYLDAIPNTPFFLYYFIDEILYTIPYNFLQWTKTPCSEKEFHFIYTTFQMTQSLELSFNQTEIWLSFIFWCKCFSVVIIQYTINTDLLNQKSKRKGVTYISDRWRKQNKKTQDKLNKTSL